VGLGCEIERQTGTTVVRIGIIGNGNVGSNLYKAFKTIGHDVKIFTRKPDADTHPIESISSFNLELIMLCVIDSSIADVTTWLQKQNLITSIIVHTSGATSIDEIKSDNPKGVFYPLQTIRKGKAVDWSKTPIFIEGLDNTTSTLLRELAESISPKIQFANSEQRLAIHLSAVISNNFMNALAIEAYHLLKNHDLDYDNLRPILQETFNKIVATPPDLTQTGPAIRGDQDTISKHIKFLENRNSNPLLDVYKSITNLIQSRNGK
jgi:predicted short-subunit dehydrogenase-like oxidoreductase (DUF2520 family)